MSHLYQDIISKIIPCFLSATILSNELKSFVNNAFILLGNRISFYQYRCLGNKLQMFFHRQFAQAVQAIHFLSNHVRLEERNYPNRHPSRFVTAQYVSLEMPSLPPNLIGSHVLPSLLEIIFNAQHSYKMIFEIQKNDFMGLGILPKPFRMIIKPIKEI